MSIKQRTRIFFSLSGLILLGSINSGKAEAPSPLDVNQHPASPQYESLFPDQVVPLDAQLSWKERFTGDESFNAEESLPPTSPVIEQLSTSSSPGSTLKSSGFDTTGVIKQIKLAEGKVKIKHGPIERLGMPAMTMMFRLEDPDKLAGLDKGETVAFNVDNTAAGFSITAIETKAHSYDTTGVVKQVKTSDSKVKIAHGPIDRLGMPAMTMMFRVEDTGLLVGLEKGAEVAFNVDNTAAGFSITQLKVMSADSVKSFDAQGTVKSVRASQGKVKIEHGPIEKLGMPGMTMLFKVVNSKDLEALEKGMSVEFDVVNGSGGFEIPRIQQVAVTESNMESKNAEDRLCYKIGPFQNQARAQDVGDRYRGRGATSRLSSSEEQVYIGDMVYIDGFETREAAHSTGNDLKARGIKDYRVLNEPDKRNALSLGVFGLKSNADHLKAQVEAMDYSAKTEARYRQQVVFWLHNEQSAGSATINLLAASDMESGVRQIPSSCSVKEVDA